MTRMEELKKRNTPNSVWFRNKPHLCYIRGYWYCYLHAGFVDVMSGKTLAEAYDEWERYNSETVS
jgi:hypothetical protein